MDANAAKFIAMLALGIGSFITGMIPAWFSEGARQKYPLLISCLLCFGGGVLLSTSLVHMLPEAREGLPKYSELMLCIGFFLVYLVDEIVHFFYEAGQNHHQHENRQQHVNYQNEMTRSYGTERSSLLPRSDLEGRERCCSEGENPRMCHVSHTEPCNQSSSGVIGMLCALFVHSLLEGLAIGIQENASQVLLLLGAVASHKYVVGFCVGAELCASGKRLCAHIVSITLFSGGSVAGIGIGAGLQSVTGLQNSVAVPIMQALAAGTLLYVTVSEVLPRERARWHERQKTAGVAQFLSVCVGFVLMYLSTIYLDHDAP